MKILLPFLLVLSLPAALAVCPDGKTYPVTFTFDDGPHTALTPKVLDVLDAEKVKGTFFVLGENLAGGKGNPNNKTKYQILDRMKKSGHAIGSHTFHHYNHPEKSDATIRENIFKANSVLKGYVSPILRLPYGGGAFKTSKPEVQKKNDFVMKTVKEAGYKHVLWDIDTNDWDPKKRANLLPTMLKDICRKKGGVVLFHDIHPNTVNNLQTWIRAVKAEGHQFVGIEHFVPEVRQSFQEEACEEMPGLPKMDDIEILLKFVNEEL